MIQVTVRLKENQISYLHVRGHALANEYGKDLVCAGVSAVVFGALNALENSSHIEIEVLENDVIISCDKEASTHNQIVLFTLLVQLQTIEESYPKNIKITKERR